MSDLRFWQHFLLAFVVVLAVLEFLVSTNDRERVGAKLDIPIPRGGELLYFHERRSTFNGDGITHAVFQFEEKYLGGLLYSMLSWEPLPVSSDDGSEVFSRIFYGENSAYEASESLDWGLYYFEDKQPDSVALDYTLAIFDLNTNRLYFVDRST